MGNIPSGMATSPGRCTVVNRPASDSMASSNSSGDALPLMVPNRRWCTAFICPVDAHESVSDMYTCCRVRYLSAGMVLDIGTAIVVP